MKKTVFACIPTLVILLLAEFMLQLMGFPYAPDALLRPHFVVTDDGMIETSSLLVKFEGGGYYQKFPRKKRSGVFRVAFLGGSSVCQLGDAQLFQNCLVKAKIGTKVEVLNFGLCGCGTDRALVSARQALDLDVDAIVLYSGHNEFTSQSNDKTYRQPGWFRRTSKICQLCTGNPWQPEPGRFYTDEEKKAVYDRFRENLRQLSVMSRKASVPLVWGTVASNLSLPPVLYTSDIYEKFELPPEPMREFRRGLEHKKEKRYDEAKQCFQKAIADSPRPLRATWQVNLILRETAEELSVPLADVERRIYQQAPHGITGPELFFDHCHLNGQGVSIMLESFAEALLRELR